MPRKCVNHPDSFCYVCGDLAFKDQRRSLTPLVKKCYELYFGCKVGDQDKNWAPHICCLTCVKRLTDWTTGSRHMNFAIPMVWREPQDHSSDCYFCITYLLTPWGRVLLEKLTGFAASQEIPRIFGTRRFITVLTSVHHMSLS